MYTYLKLLEDLAMKDSLNISSYNFFSLVLSKLEFKTINIWINYLRKCLRGVCWGGNEGYCLIFKFACWEGGIRCLFSETLLSDFIIFEFNNPLIHPCMTYVTYIEYTICFQNFSRQILTWRSKWDFCNMQFIKKIICGELYNNLSDRKYHW